MQSSKHWLNAVIEELKERGIKPTPHMPPEAIFNAMATISLPPGHESVVMHAFVAHVVREYIPATSVPDKSLAEFTQRVNSLRKEIAEYHEKRVDYLLKLMADPEEWEAHKRDTSSYTSETLLGAQRARDDLGKRAKLAARTAVAALNALSAISNRAISYAPGKCMAEFLVRAAEARDPDGTSPDTYPALLEWLYKSLPAPAPVAQAA